ncbi:MAG: glucose 1-dehydrogenase [Myxococcales bacterium]|jgi:glucose 1-dehydrogenase
MEPHQEITLAGQVALVTGANSGIGRATALSLGAAGAAVGVNYVQDPESARDVVARIEASGGRAIAVEADVSREDQVQAMVRRVVDELGGLHIMVSNAGIQRDVPLLEMGIDDWNAVVAVNLTGAFLCAREAAREFVRRGPRPELSRATGKLIFMSSVHQRIPWSGHVNYAATKGGIMQLMLSCAQELAEHRIRVNAVAPGAVKTPINREAWSTPKAEQQLLQLIPYGRIGEPADIARAVVWLASDHSDYVHGTTLFVDGGMTLFPGFATGPQ